MLIGKDQASNSVSYQYNFQAGNYDWRTSKLIVDDLDNVYSTVFYTENGTTSIFLLQTNSEGEVSNSFYLDLPNYNHENVNDYNQIIKTQNFTFSNAQQFQQITLSDTNIIQIVEAVDSDGNTWYEVPYLAQDTIIDKIEKLKKWSNIQNLENI